MDNVLRVVGARSNNLKNITVEIPRGKLAVITGLSGSGKSTLAFDTIFAEGQRRYVESLSSYARQFLGQMDKPDVDVIEGLSPAVSIDQKGTSRNPRSTVGTITEIYDYLRLLYARIGIPHCPVCGREVSKQSAEEIINNVSALPDGSKIMVLAPVVRARKGTYQSVLEDIRRGGFMRVRIDGAVYSLDDEITLDRYKIHTIEAVIDRLIIRNEEDEEAENRRSRLADSIETALKIGEGYVTIANLSADPPVDMAYSEFLACPEHGYGLTEIEPRSFSFNTPHGACPACQGLGVRYEIDPDLVIPDRSKSLNEGAIVPMEWSHDQSGQNDKYYWQQLCAVCTAYQIDMNKPVNELTEKQVNVLLYGTGGQAVNIELVGRNERKSSYQAPFEGVITNLRRRYNETGSDYIKNMISVYMQERVCPECKGKRLRPEALAVTINGENIIEVSNMPVSGALAWMREIQKDDSLLTPTQRVIAEKVFREIISRLEFLANVGLEYLTLSRSAVTLSGGEAQRIRLATQIGSQLMGVLYVLDEPSIGLHARDNDKLLKALQRLRDIGNTVIVVEHDEETIRAADWIVDMGPGAGVNGGEVLVSGTLEDVINCPRSLTGDYISGRKQVPIPKQRRKPSKDRWLVIKGASQNNLKHINVKIPLGLMVCITGVSGSGKSSLMNEIVYKALANKLNHAKMSPGKYNEILGIEYLDKIINIDQSPIGRTPRSNPGTYTGVFDEIRKLFADLPESKMRGYKAGRFSFNVHGGRCEACQGQGQLCIEMQFLSDVYVPCDVCHGTGYNHETLQVKFKGKNIAEVLDMTVDDGIEFFSAFPAIAGKLKLLQEVGLGYLKIGQSGNTLSGGEAQRVKLSKELARRATGKTIYVLDEPSVGLHAADVHRLIDVLQQLVNQGNTVLIIEHNMDIIKTADYIIDLGPEGGDRGGNLVAVGTPEKIAACEESFTGQFLKPVLGL